MNKTIKNRGSLSNIEGRFEKEIREAFDDGWDSTLFEEELPTLDTTLLIEKAKSIITHNDSPDIGFEQSINPYRGCEHGCIYCYARPSHAYVNLSPGVDFESKIFYKLNAAELLENEINHPNYVCKPIVIGANTDPYQPAEGKLRITRSLLEVANEYKHPIAIITKNTLIERDMDLLEKLAKDNLIRVAITLTTLSIKLKTTLEPRASAPLARLRVIRRLTGIDVPVTVMASPMIPMINDMELEKILIAAKEAGAVNAGYTLIRLPHEVKVLFKEWLQRHYPERAEHIMSLIKQMRGGKEYDATFGKRMTGEGPFATLLADRFTIICRKLKLNDSSTRRIISTHLFKKKRYNNQLLLDI